MHAPPLWMTSLFGQTRIVGHKYRLPLACPNSHSRLLDVLAEPGFLFIRSKASSAITDLPVTCHALEEVWCRSQRHPCLANAINRHKTTPRRVLTKAHSMESVAVIVEGLSDKKAVQRAVPSAVFVLGSSTWLEGANAERILSSLRSGLSNFNRAVTLLDPDGAGRRGREKLEAAFPGRLWHAFLPVPYATAVEATKWHDAGNVGVEHAPPQSIRLALSRARQASPGRTVFSRELLLDKQLVATHTARPGTQTKLRRDLVCSLLGIGTCDGKQLLRQLNVYGFEMADLLEAVREADKTILNTASQGECSRMMLIFNATEEADGNPIKGSVHVRGTGDTIDEFHSGRFSGSEGDTTGHSLDVLCHSVAAGSS